MSAACGKLSTNPDLAGYKALTIHVHVSNTRFVQTDPYLASRKKHALACIYICRTRQGHPKQPKTLRRSTSNPKDGIFQHCT